MKRIRKEIDRLMRSQSFGRSGQEDNDVYRCAEGIAAIENCTAVVSDLKSNTSRIFHGRFSERLGLSAGSLEHSIWEREIIEKMDESEQREKYLSELRFFHFLRRIPSRRRRDYYLATALRFRSGTEPGSGLERDPESGAGAGPRREPKANPGAGRTDADPGIEVLHRMFYRYGEDAEIIRYALCIYGPLTFSLPAKSVAVNSVSGELFTLSPAEDHSILSPREKQVLTLIETGLTSQEIAGKLFISKHTVSRHRQEILAKLKAKNSAEALRTAKMLKLI